MDRKKFLHSTHIDLPRTEYLNLTPTFLGSSVNVHVIADSYYNVKTKTKHDSCVLYSLQMLMSPILCGCDVNNIVLMWHQQYCADVMSPILHCHSIQCKAHHLTS